MKYILFSALLCSVLFACKKDEDDPPQPTKTEHLSASTWKYESGGVDADMNGSIDLAFGSVFLPIPACVLDNTATFQANGTGVADEGTTKCDVAHPQTTPFTWAFANNETKLTITGAGLFGVSGQFNVSEVSANKLSLSKDTVMMGSNSRLIVNMIH